MSWNPKYAILIGTSTLITYFSGLLIEGADKRFEGEKSVKLKKFWVFGSLFTNLGILFLFKYYNFFTSSLTRLFSLFNITLQIPTFDFLLPVGISFYTFQALSYTIDVYRGDIKAEKNLGKYALFVAFFPQLVAGPIEKSKDLLYQFDEEHSFDYRRAKSGLVLMLWGFFEKMVVADRLAIFVNTVYNNPNNYKGMEIIVATIFFAFQIYCDFASYSDIARGAAEVMDFRLSTNFRQPYLSKSIKEFWRRWHITLGAWFKDYLYIPLGGNRCSKPRNYFNIMTVFLISGLWHGAAANFVIWGALHGAYQVIGDILRPIKDKAIEKLHIKADVFGFRVFQVIITFILVDFAWIFFRANTFTDAKILIKNMMYFNPWVFTSGSIYKLGLDFKDFRVAIIGIIIVIIVDLLKRNGNLRIKLEEQNVLFKWALYMVTVICILVFGMYGPGFNAQQFIYFQF
jgi:D-alanyl-lipoteichoic acid acyltransferase DltB (MBOAT superfamily)